ncbi:S-layer homology domain-containing protein [Cohnella sp. CFH 77786]|uniref:S-layer homology domain-containing protein n=1 Tax=Cohnella sp. CFH 77786 TaxID=2662265 RepID=UPI001C60BF30|nr:S-layer homology domain-containing protein [Cohnella sp. CFH 77786]MBW5445898.1 S-layer homology domain-containing protein [Cohnella sp. CFH 77786]
MKPNRLRITLWLLIVALVLPTLPMSPSITNAAPSVYFQFRDFSTDQTAPTDVNSNITDIAGTFSGVTASSISYKIEQLVNGKAVQTTVGSTRPTITGNSFLFSGVSLYDGLNRISITGVNTTGNAVSGDAYVNFNNVPVITEIKLADGRDLADGATVVTTRSSEAINIKAPNATEVTINGTQMIGGSGSTFVLSNIGLTPGQNKLVIVARNATKTYQQTRYLAYYNGNFTAYDIQAGTQPLDGNPTFSTAQNNVPVTGKVIVSSTSPAPNITVSLKNGATTVATVTDAAPVSVGTGTGYVIYSFTTGNLTIDTTGDYTLTVTNTTPTPNTDFPITFKFRDSTSPFITDVQQAYNVTEGTPVSYTSFSSFPNNSTVFKTPFWMVLNTGNFSASGGTTTVTATQGGNPVPSGSFTYDATFRNQNDQPVIKITNMPSGTITLTFKITSGGKSDTITRTLTFTPAPSIQLDNLFDGMTWTNDFVSSDRFNGTLVNFNLTNDDELDTLKLNFNGIDYDLLPASAPRTTTSGGFSFDPYSKGLHLVPGPNTLIFKGVANGVPVSTTLTLYYVSGTNPSISNMFPVPFVVDPTVDTTPPVKRQFSDTLSKFVSTGTKQYNTTEKKLDLIFDVANATDMEVQVDGNSLATVSLNSTSTPAKLNINDTNATDGIGLCFEVVVGSVNQCLTSIDNTSPVKLRLWNVGLPQSGATSITVIVRAGTVSVSETVTIIRDLSPYIVLSPKLPEESVINANFLKISIKAEGADQVLVGKVEMTKGQGDIFRYELKPLKPGNNTVKFTVVQGKQKINGSFTVNYAADNSISAQYKAKIPTSGKLAIFKNDLTLSFPKNTFLRQANLNPGQDVKTVDLFDAQELYFGIADRTDGRAVKKYNAVGEQDPDGNYLDGTIKTISTDDFAIDRIRPLNNFNFASNLFWVDAGYFDSSKPDYTLVNAMDPFAANHIFYNRVFEPNKWLEPSQRGTITIKYDSNIRDALASNLSVWRYTSSGWINVGGVTNTKNKTVTASFDGFGYYAVMALRYSYSDIIGHPYARFSLETMLSKGIMANKDNNNFGVYDNITRGEFAQMLVKALDIPLEYDPNNMTFDDVLPINFPGALWNYRYVETAVKKGFIRGKSPRLFFPNDPITRQEASVMVARALNLVKSNANAEKDLAALQKQFTDANTMDIYAASSVQAVVKAKFISGIVNTQPAKTFRFEPDSFLKRADAAVITEKILKSLKKL